MESEEGGDTNLDEETDFVDTGMIPEHVTLECRSESHRNSAQNLIALITRQTSVLKLVINTSQVNWSSIFILPVSVTKTIEQLMRRFYGAMVKILGLGTTLWSEYSALEADFCNSGDMKRDKAKGYKGNYDTLRDPKVAVQVRALRVFANCNDRPHVLVKNGRRHADAVTKQIDWLYLIRGLLLHILHGCYVGNNGLEFGRVRFMVGIVNRHIVLAGHKICLCGLPSGVIRPDMRAMRPYLALGRFFRNGPLRLEFLELGWEFWSMNFLCL
ncbi:hypothetical protein R6Q59_028399 [Mikania micrantha]